MDDFKRVVDDLGDAELKKAVQNLKSLDPADWKQIRKIADDVKISDPSWSMRTGKAIEKWLKTSKVTAPGRGAVAAVKTAGKALATGLPQMLARTIKLNRDKAKNIGVPNIDIDDIELFLLPIDWYKSPENFLTENEKLVARRVKIGFRGFVTSRSAAYAGRGRKAPKAPAASEKSSEASLGQKAQEKLQDIVLPAGQYGMSPEQTRKLQLDMYSKEDLAEDPDLAAPNIPYNFIESNLGVSAAVWNVYRDELAKIESGGNYKSNRKGSQYDGRYAIGAAARKQGAKHIGVDPVVTEEQREAFRNNPELQEMIFAGMTYGNHLLLNRTTLTDKYRQIEDPIERIKILAYAHNQGYKSAAKWLETGASTVDGFGTDGTEFYNAVSAALSPGEKISTQEMKAIIFGHSQTYRFGETLKSKIEAQGGEVFPTSLKERVNSSKSDSQLAEIIKNISPEDGPFTHAYLFLGGNTLVPGTKDGEIIDQEKYDRYVSDAPREGDPDYDLAKEEIIDYVVNTLKVPKENILVILPPVNRDNTYSASRKMIHDKAEQIFKTLGITTLIRQKTGKEAYI